MSEQQLVRGEWHRYGEKNIQPLYWQGVHVADYCVDRRSWAAEDNGLRLRHEFRWLRPLIEQYNEIGLERVLQQYNIVLLMPKEGQRAVNW